MPPEVSDKSALITTAQESSGGTLVTLCGRLDASTLPKAWTEVVDPTRKGPPQNLLVDVAQLTYCDGAGLGFFAELRRIVTASGGTMQFKNVRPEQQRLMEMSELKDPLAGELGRVEKPGSVTQLGKSTWAMLQDLRQLIAFTGELTATLFWAMRHPTKIRGRDMLRVADKAGARRCPSFACWDCLWA